jgi:hypothetical protein
MGRMDSMHQSSGIDIDKKRMWLALLPAIVIVVLIGLAFSSAGGEGIAGHRIFTFCTFVRVPFVFESAAVAVVNRVPVLFLQ